MTSHLPVLLAEVLTALAPRADGVYVDGTFGAGGYSRAILEAAPGCHVVGIDRDPAAEPRAAALAAEFDGRLTFLPGRFGDMVRLLTDAGIPQVDGVALDVGVSSMQIDQAERGFSFMRNGPLDMRMDTRSGETAADVVNTLAEEDLANVIYRFGEERMSRRVARAIAQARETLPFTTTGQLASVIRSVVRKSKDGIDPATRTFQALRIYVNDEIGELERGLAGAEALLRPDGRLAVVSFHSLEDRVVKAFLRDRSGSERGRLLPGEPTPPPPTFELLSRKAVAPTAAEAKANPRARSAKLRSALRTSMPARPWTWGDVQ
ncbi:MAG: 16S rRNA methyltransferase [Rhodospirillaceae bacterium BRH_c57]|nr:MAG: 16S rRNA methyltransferase [Rhodospirillaceae bacterium BRH_c57]